MNANEVDAVFAEISRLRTNDPSLPAWMNIIMACYKSVMEEVSLFNVSNKRIAALKKVNERQLSVSRDLKSENVVLKEQVEIWRQKAHNSRRSNERCMSLVKAILLLSIFLFILINVQRIKVFCCCVFGDLFELISSLNFLTSSLNSARNSTMILGKIHNVTSYRMYGPIITKGWYYDIIWKEMLAFDWWVKLNIDHCTNVQENEVICCSVISKAAVYRSDKTSIYGELLKCSAVMCILQSFS